MTENEPKASEGRDISAVEAWRNENFGYPRQLGDFVNHWFDSPSDDTDRRRPEDQSCQ